MTDVFLLNEEGDFFTGKAATTPQDESLGYMESLKDACLQAGIEMKKGKETILSPVKACVYSGTTMMNTLLQHVGRKTGLIVTEGFEDPFIQAYRREAYSAGQDTHIYEEQAKNVIRELLDEKVEAIAVCFLWSFMNLAHEQKVAELAREAFKD